MQAARVNRGILISVLLLLLLSACGGGGSSSTNPPNQPPPPAGTMQFNAGSVSVDEGAGTASLTVTRTAGSAGIVVVTVASGNGTATAGTDFTAVNTTVTFADGDTAAKTVTVQITNDTQAEAEKSFVLNLLTPTAGAILGQTATAIVTIRDDDPPSSPPMMISAGLKQFVFDWIGVDFATHYLVLEDPGDGSGFAQVGPMHAATDRQAKLDVALHRVNWPNIRFRLDACNAHGCTPSTIKLAGSLLVVGSIGYVKASNTEQGDQFGQAVALSADGNTLAVGSLNEDSNATGVDGNQGDESAQDSGAVYVFTRTAAGWEQQAYLKASNTRAGDAFGNAVSLSADGNTLAVGAFAEDSNAAGVNPAPGTNTAPDSGAVYVFNRDATGWHQRAYIKSANSQPDDSFGFSVALSDDAQTLAVGAISEDSDLTGVNPVGDNFNSADSGAAYVFTQSAGVWTQQAYIKASNTGQGDQFGFAVSLSAAGDTLAVGARLEDGDGLDQNSDAVGTSGAAYVFELNGQQWKQDAYVKASDPFMGDLFGSSLDLSSDGRTLAVGSPHESSASTGVNGDPTGVGQVNSGAVYVFTRGATSWTQTAYVKASNTFAVDVFGTSVALSADGATLAVGAPQEFSPAKGIGGTQTTRNLHFAGSVYVFTRDTAQQWSQRTYVKASNTGADDQFGFSLGLSGDGTTLAVSANSEASSATGVNGDQSDNNAQQAGAVYLY
jgi:hypothetical protein